jgi:hypothetical protein
MKFFVDTADVRKLAPRSSAGCHTETLADRRTRRELASYANWQAIQRSGDAYQRYPRHTLRRDGHDAPIAP